jgi:hypothetical protein
MADDGDSAELKFVGRAVEVFDYGAGGLSKKSTVRGCASLAAEREEWLGAHSQRPSHLPTPPPAVSGCAPPH